MNNDKEECIAKRKRVRACTEYPIYNFVSYDGLSPSFRGFTTSLSSISNGVDWKAAIEDEIQALEKEWYMRNHQIAPRKNSNWV